MMNLSKQKVYKSKTFREFFIQLQGINFIKYIYLIPQKKSNCSALHNIHCGQFILVRYQKDWCCWHCLVNIQVDLIVHTPFRKAIPYSFRRALIRKWTKQSSFVFKIPYIKCGFEVGLGFWKLIIIFLFPSESSSKSSSTHKLQFISEVFMER